MAARPTTTSTPSQPVTTQSLPAQPALPPARPAAVTAPPPLAQVLADPVQAAARQDSLAPLLAKAASVLAAPAAAASFPRPVIEAVVRLLAVRVDLNRAPLDGKALKEAVLKAGVLSAPAPSQGNARSALLALRSAALGFLGGEVEPVAPVGSRPPPPLKGEPPRAPEPRLALPQLGEEPAETVRQLLGHTDSALSRLKLLQHASSPPDARPGAAALASPELRVEIPLQLGAETGILQLLVERDGRRKATPRERGWRMRFALNFSATGEVGAEIALFGRAANIGLWAAEPATAAALEAMLPELAPALARRGLEVTGLHVRRGAPRRQSAAPGQLLDSAR
ncbi:flagellar hook-length control protein FliK [Devosia sp. ZB163]|uniref:flagellar hook-length control protein FliK n=1 Tax=Devosia sp. ZB163 TaxID=3025938 RepID=UPI002361C915|nr:flagellar hook-length control protein FliK [Devosia sp. ZB163]MDC9823118.1 flagellar hook-length control protein FliK [Devosia sp. ZB163]